MEVQITYTNLSEAPYSKELKDAFSFDDEQVSELLNDLLYATPTCYLISGYRGVGKTSLIKRVEADIQELKPKASEHKPKLIFVHTSFAQSETKTNIVRRLIRELYLKIQTNQDYVNLSVIQNEIKPRFEMLYQQTFKDIQFTASEEKNAEKTVKAEISINKILDIGEKALSILAPVISLFIWHFVESTGVTSSFLKYVVPAGLCLWAILKSIQVSIGYNRTNKTSSGLFVKTLFDDEIAGTHLTNVLKDLKTLQFKVVFVLDELDKVQITELDQLINELKPYLICGHANFVVVGGQQLYYKFKGDDLVDDAVLSSLFAKNYHVHLSSPAELRKFFYNQVLNQDANSSLSPDDSKRLEQVVNYLIFASRLVPRRFVTLLRQHICWLDNKPHLNDRNLPVDLESIEKNLKIIDDLDDDVITAENSPAVRDHVITTMYLKCFMLLTNRKKKISRDAFING